MGGYVGIYSLEEDEKKKRGRRETKRNFKDLGREGLYYFSSLAPRIEKDAPSQRKMTCFFDV